MDKNASIKHYFPIFEKQQALTSKPFVYLDSAASTQKPSYVIDSICNFYTTYNSNIKRGLYPIGELATQAYETARASIAKFINAESPAEIIFTKGTTEAINLVANAWALQHLSPNDEILLTQAEHHANILPWQQIAKKTGALLKFIPIDKKTYLTSYDSSMITNKTKLVAIPHSSNVLGNIWHEGQLSELLTKARNVGAKILIDGAQTVLHQKVDVLELGIDFFAFSGHKMFGPTGIGALYASKRIWNEMEPYQLGGSMVYSVSFNDATWADMPQKFEAGTPPISSALGLGAAAEFLTQYRNPEESKKHEAMLCKAALEGLQALDGIEIVGNLDYIQTQGHMICFAVKGIHPHDIAGYLGDQGVAIRAGHHCAQPLVTMLGFEALARVSFAIYNNQSDVETFITQLKKTIDFFRSV